MIQYINGVHIITQPSSTLYKFTPEVGEAKDENCLALAAEGLP